MANYTTSTNILRDKERDINYISTPNAQKVFKRILANYKTGHHAFNIIGSYGTGKSSFLWALEKNLEGEHYYFEQLNGQFNGLKEFNFLKLVGDYDSFRETLNEELGISRNATAKETIQKLEQQSSKLNSKNQVLVLLVDEFGKFLEYAAKTDPENELYFIQQLAEFANDPNRQVVFITTLHQNFAAYAKNLSVDQKQEWDKVRGRIIDIAFDEPVEQLLLLSAERITSFNKKPAKALKQKEIFATINKSKLLSNAENLDWSLAQKLFPLDYLSAYVLVQALQKYGQNERSLFTFLASEEENAISQFNAKGTYHLGKVFDYLVENLTSELEDPDTNPHKSTWRSIEEAIDQIETLNNSETDDLIDLVKVIGLVSIFAKPLGLLDKETLANYAEEAMSIENARSLIDKLVSQRIIKYFRAKNKLFFQSGTDLDFEFAYSKARSELQPVKEVVPFLKEYLDLNLVPAKRVQYLKGTPRYFQFNLLDITETGELIEPVNEVDGFIHVLFSDENEFDFAEKSSEHSAVHLFVDFIRTQELRKLIFEIMIFDHVLKNDADDQWAKKILVEEKEHSINELKSLVMKGLFDKSACAWWSQGKIVQVNSYRNLNALISTLADAVYTNIPVYRNEMVNKELLSGPILTARKKLLDQLLSLTHEAELGFPDSKYPPEKTIYLSLLKKTGIHRQENGQWLLGEPVGDDSFAPLWEKSLEFLKESTHQKRTLSDFYQILEQPPFKLKRGFIDYWVPIFLIVKQQDYALFHSEQGYIPYLTTQVLDLVHKKPEAYQIKAYEIEGVKVDLFNKYKEITGLDDVTKGKEESFIKIFSNFFIFYNQLPEYSKQTKRLSKSALQLREAIKNAKDPEQALLKEFPAALGFNEINLSDNGAVERFVSQLNEAIYEIRTAFQELVERVETSLVSSVSKKSLAFEEYQALLHKRFAKIKEHMLTAKQKVLSKRIKSRIEERDHYIISISDAVIGKDIHKLSDDEEPVLLDRLPEAILDLEKQIPLQQLKEERKEDEVFYFEVHQAEGNPIKDKVTLSQKDANKASEIEKEILSILDKHKGISKAVLLKLLQKKL